MRNLVKRAKFLLISMAFLVLVLIVIDEPLEANSVGVGIAPALPRVSYIEVTAGEHRSELSLYGELAPRWDVTIKAQVNGEVVKLSPSFEAGAALVKNTRLMSIEDSQYQAELTSAEWVLAQSRLQLRQAQEKTALAKKDWLQSGINQAPSDLALFEPQLILAKQNVKASERQLKVAQRNLSYTQVQTPFSGVVTERFVGLGQLVFAGDPIVRLMDDQHLQLSVSLNDQQWANLPEHWQGQTVPLYTTNEQYLGKAKIARGGHRVDSETRQHKLFLEVNTKHLAAAIPGKFVRVKIAGKIQPHCLSVPEAALTREGLVWFIDAQNTLRSFTPKQITHVGEQVLISPPDNAHVVTNQAEGGINTKNQAATIWRIATTPLAFYLQGKPVQPIKRKEG